jgi:hypothetical protein
MKLTPEIVAKNKIDLDGKYFPSARKAKDFIWSVLRELKMNKGIKESKIGRSIVRCYGEYEPFSFEFDFPNKKMYLTWGEKSIEELKAEKEHQVKLNQLMPQEIRDAFTKQGDTSELSSAEIPVIAKFFNAGGAGTWYCYEYLPEEETFWCYANLGDPRFAELGKVSLTELLSFKGMFELGIERDIHFEVGKYTVQEIMDKVQNGQHI